MKEGESFTLDSGLIKHPNDVMTWYFNETEITGDQSKICTDVQCKKRFGERLKLDHQTGSLTIMSTRTTDSGEYLLQINSSDSSFSITTVMRFSVSVTALPDSDLSSAAVAGIFVAVILLVAVAVAAGVVNYRCRRRTAVPQNDIESSHTARIIKLWYEEHDGEFLSVPWPPHSPDMNPIEHLLFYLEKGVCPTSPPFCNVQELEDWLLNIWYQKYQESNLIVIE
ncbi:uncharacterized protein LOC132159341 [Carassius carassius]|uniref:uncharacterized protein LOC132159341 n=1 Tax=Carassius carassius TaxID=217509 RepID=UPI0028693103|nr:uncharacterized protein LOC132159341 [Carassius carassius]